MKLQRVGKDQFQIVSEPGNRPLIAPCSQAEAQRKLDLLNEHVHSHTARRAKQNGHSPVHPSGESTESPTSSAE